MVSAIRYLEWGTSCLNLLCRPDLSLSLLIVVVPSIPLNCMWLKSKPFSSKTSFILFTNALVPLLPTASTSPKNSYFNSVVSKSTYQTNIVDSLARSPISVVSSVKRLKPAAATNLSLNLLSKWLLIHKRYSSQQNLVVKWDLLLLSDKCQFISSSTRSLKILTKSWKFYFAVHFLRPAKCMVSRNFLMTQQFLFFLFFDKRFSLLHDYL